MQALPEEPVPFWISEQPTAPRRPQGQKAQAGTSETDSAPCLCDPTAPPPLPPIRSFGGRKTWHPGASLPQLRLLTSNREGKPGLRNVNLCYDDDRTEA